MFLLEMEVRTFVRIQKVIWDQLLTSEAEKLSRERFIAVLVPNCSVVLSCPVFCFVLFCSLPGSFFRLNDVRKVRKRCSHLIFSSQPIILDFFDQNIASCYVHVFGCYGRPSLPLSTQAIERGNQKKILIGCVFVRFRRNFHMIKLDAGLLESMKFARKLSKEEQDEMVQQTKQAIQLVYANRIIYSHILLFDLEKRTKYISETEQDPSIHKRTGKTIN